MTGKDLGAPLFAFAKMRKRFFRTPDAGGRRIQEARADQP